jgi:3-hydroxymyristoyl/3-hydroxydecanoyl-(acyl carrier protein) dehydratase
MTTASSVPLKLEPDVVAVRQTANGVALELRITADLAPLAGHFPGLPIVPGVALVDWVVRFAVRHVGFHDDGVARLQIKFRRVLQPDCDVTLTLHKVSDRRVRFEYRHLDTIYSSGTIASSDT